MPGPKETLLQCCWAPQAAVLLPAGFFLGGIVIYDGDPGLGVWLVPIGAALLFYSIARIALDLRKLK
jgi:hypothetical protein